MKTIAILGSTGSIGTQTLDVVRQHPGRFSVFMLSANSSAQLLVQQALAFHVPHVVICNPAKFQEVRDALPASVQVHLGIQAACDLVQAPQVDVVVAAMVGFSGLRPTLSAIRAGKTIALANKETLVAAGALIMPLARKHGAPILPVDSEHSAIFQCLQGEHARLEKILLTGSGGPFLHSSREEIAAATRDQALNHPRWRMGAKVTIDSASLMNKGLELIEARWLFNVEPGDIEVVIHPQSIIHSMVQFSDGCVMAQLSQPDMRLPIQYALSYPSRIDLNTRRIDFAELTTLTFERPDLERFPCLGLAYSALEKGGNATCAMNGANEVAVAAFLEGKIRFVDIPEIIATTMERSTFVAKPSFDDIYSTDFEAKRIAFEIIDNH